MRQLLLICCLCLTGQVYSTGPAKKPVVVDDFFTLGFLGEVAISPNGECIAYTEGRWQEATNDRKNDIWLVSADGKDRRRLTFDRVGYDSLKWSADAKSLYFAAEIKRAGETQPPYDGSRQVWRVTFDRPELTPVTRVPGGIGKFDLSTSKGWLIYAAATPKDLSPWVKLRTTHSKVQYGNRKSVLTKFHKLDFKTWRTTELAQFAGSVDSFDVNADASRAAMVTAPDAAVITMEGQSKVTILDFKTGVAAHLPDDLWRMKPHVKSPFGRVTSPKWSADDKLLALAVGFDAYPSELFVVSWDDKHVPQIKKIPRPYKTSLHGGVDGGITFHWRGVTHDLCFLGDDEGRVRLFCATEVTTDKCSVRSLTTGDVVVDAFAWDEEGKRAAAIVATSEKMRDVSVFADDKWVQVTDIHAHTQDWSLPTIKFVEWTGCHGEKVYGILELPAGHQPGTPLPTIVQLHGGPTLAATCELQYGYFGSVLFASQGYAFFSPNYRGSTGYGDKFITDLVGHVNDVEVEDILKGIEHLINERVVDKEKVAVAGWSNGGYLTNCLITRYDRFQFKAASSGAGIADHTLEWGTNDEPAFPEIFLGGTPWEREKPDAYRKASPIFAFGAVKTPTLLHVGVDDVRCPKGNSEMAHRALKEKLGVDSELLIYPDEEHGLSAYSSRKAKMEWDLAWFDHYLKGKPKP